MKHHSYVCMAFSLLIGSCLPIAQHTERLAIIDTVQRERYHLQEPFATIARTAGYEMNHITIADLADTRIDDLDLDDYQTAFFLLDQAFLIALKRSPLAQKVLRIIKHFAHKPKTMVGLFFPSSIPLKQGVTPVQGLPDLFSCVGITSSVQPSDEGTRMALVEALIHIHATASLERRPTPYHTTLKNPRRGVSTNELLATTLGSDAIQTLNAGLSQKIALLPYKASLDDRIKPLAPLGIYVYNTERNNHLFIGHETLLTFASIAENYHICPTDPDLKNALLQALLITLTQLKQLTAQHTGATSVATTLAPTPQQVLPLSVAAPGPQRRRGAAAFKMPRTTAWMELHYNSPGLSYTTMLDPRKLAEQIAESEIDSLWISLSPNIFYAENAWWGAHKQKMLEAVDTFTQELRRACSASDRQLPAILIGFEISNNYHAYPPKTLAQDIYGITYQHCPHPFDRQLWEEQILASVPEFLKDWKRYSNGIPISGFVFDFEMYTTRPGTFTATMGFTKKDAPEVLATRRRMKAFFERLQDEAHNLGLEIKNRLRELVPGCILGCYAPNMGVNWFYKGLYQGLSSAQEPLLFLTFNTEYERHRTWLEQQHIFGEHACALMLGKAQRSARDVAPFIDSIRNHHHGIWPNRLSRLAQEYDRLDSWELNEATPLDDAGKSKVLRMLGGPLFYAPENAGLKPGDEWGILF